MPTEAEIEKKVNTNFRLNTDMVKWLLMIAFSAGMIYAGVKYETQTHAEDTYLRKEVYMESQKGLVEDRNEILKRLDRIEDKLDELTRTKNR